MIAASGIILENENGYFKEEGTDGEVVYTSSIGNAKIIDGSMLGINDLMKKNHLHALKARLIVEEF